MIVVPTPHLLRRGVCPSCPRRWTRLAECSAGNPLRRPARSRRDHWPWPLRKVSGPPSRPRKSSESLGRDPGTAIALGLGPCPPALLLQCPLHLCFCLRLLRPSAPLRRRRSGCQWQIASREHSLHSRACAASGTSRSVASTSPECRSPGSMPTSRDSVSSTSGFGFRMGASHPDARALQRSSGPQRAATSGPRCSRSTAKARSTSFGAPRALSR